VHSPHDVVLITAPLLSSIATLPETAACATCGGTECECESALADLDARASALVRDGLRAAGERRLHQAARQLGEAVLLNGGDRPVRAVLGLCRLALGDAAGARAAWRVGGTGECAAWLAALDDGELRQALREHDTALAAARSGDHDAALAAVDRALEILPGLVPAAHLRGLVLAARGDLRAARRTWTAQLDSCRDDPELLRLLVESADPADAVGSAAVAERSEPVSAVASVPAPAPRVVRWRERPGRVGAFLAGAASAAVVAVVFSLTEPPASPATLPANDFTASPPSPPSATTASPAVAAEASPAPAAGSAPASAAPSGWAAYREGRDAHLRGDWAGATAALEASVAAGEGRFYHDDALYLLARSLARAGRPDEARRAAERLASEHPASPFHNRVVRAIAATGAEPN
jgi:tetratricopeptide (TPR) repeat protein